MIFNSPVVDLVNIDILNNLYDKVEDDKRKALLKETLTDISPFYN
jgi:hypothetical protein